MVLPVTMVRAGGRHVQFVLLEKFRPLIAVNADADDEMTQRIDLFLLDEDAGDFFAAQQDIVGPFDPGRQAGIHLDGFGGGDRGGQC